MGRFLKMLEDEWKKMQLACCTKKEPNFKTYKSKLNDYRIIKRESNNGEIVYIVEMLGCGKWLTLDYKKFENFNDAEQNIISYHFTEDQRVFNISTRKITIL